VQNIYIVDKMNKKWNQDFHEILQGWKGNEDVNIESVEDVMPSLTSLTCISFHIVFFCISLWLWTLTFWLVIWNYYYQMIKFSQTLKEVHNNFRWAVVCLFSITTSGYPIKITYDIEYFSWQRLGLWTWRQHFNHKLTQLDDYK